MQLCLVLGLYTQPTISKNIVIMVFITFVDWITHLLKKASVYSVLKTTMPVSKIVLWHHAPNFWFEEHIYLRNHHSEVFWIVLCLVLGLYTQPTISENIVRMVFIPLIDWIRHLPKKA